MAPGSHVSLWHFFPSCRCLLEICLPSMQQMGQLATYLCNGQYKQALQLSSCHFKSCRAHEWTTRVLMGAFAVHSELQDVVVDGTCSSFIHRKLLMNDSGVWLEPPHGHALFELWQRVQREDPHLLSHWGGGERHPKKVPKRWTYTLRCQPYHERGTIRKACRIIRICCSSTGRILLFLFT